MSEPIWNKFLTERDKAVFATSGYGARGGFGKRPALLIIDVNYAFCGDKPEPILESIKKWRNSCGEDAWATGSSVVREAGILKADVKYEEIIDMSFVQSVRASL